MGGGVGGVRGGVGTVDEEEEEEAGARRARAWAAFSSARAEEDNGAFSLPREREAVVAAVREAGLDVEAEAACPRDLEAPLVFSLEISSF